MVEILVMGPLELRNTEGWEVRSVLAQPKRLALLAYLVLNSRRGFQRRDTLTALFWPDLDDRNARVALRQALYQLRISLGAELFQARGDEVVVQDCRIRCDALELEDRARRGDIAGALGLYRGHLLQDLRLANAPRFEHWLEAERERLRLLATRHALAAAEAADPTDAIPLARRAHELAPEDERAARHLMGVLATAGDRAAALRVYADLADQLHRDLEIEPSSATQRLADEIRADAAAQTQSAEVRPGRVAVSTNGHGNGGPAPSAGRLPLTLDCPCDADPADLYLAAAGFTRDFERFLRGEILLAAGREAEALECFAAIPDDDDGAPALIAAARWRQAQALERLGRLPDANRIRRRFLCHWHRCEAAVRPLVEEAERKLAE